MKKASGLLNPFLKSTMIGIFIPTHPSIFIFSKRSSQSFALSYKFIYIHKLKNKNTLPSCSSSFHCQNNLGTYRVLKNNLNYLLCVSYGIIEGLTRISRILSQTFRSSPYSHRPSGRDRRDRTCDTPLPCCQDSPLSASPGLWCSDASSAKNEEGSRTGYDWHNPLRHA